VRSKVIQDLAIAKTGRNFWPILYLDSAHDSKCACPAACYLQLSAVPSNVRRTKLSRQHDRLRRPAMQPTRFRSQNRSHPTIDLAWYPHSPAQAMRSFVYFGTSTTQDASSLVSPRVPKPFWEAQSELILWVHVVADRILMFITKLNQHIKSAQLGVNVSLNVFHEAILLTGARSLSCARVFFRCLQFGAATRGDCGRRKEGRAGARGAQPVACT
jgi:hypothetical protein